MRVPHELVAVKEELVPVGKTHVMSLAYAEKTGRRDDAKVRRPARGDIVEPRVIGENKDCLQFGEAEPPSTLPGRSELCALGCRRSHNLLRLTSE